MEVEELEVEFVPLYTTQLVSLPFFTLNSLDEKVYVVPEAKVEESAYEPIVKFAQNLYEP